MSIAELVSELLQGNRTIEEIANWDILQIRHVYGRERDESGKLVRHDPDMPSWVKVDSRGQRIVSNPVSYAEMYFSVKRNWKLSEEEIKEDWEQFLKDNPNFGRGGV